MIETLQLPLMIVSSPRTGSTALATTIANERGLQLFVEPSRTLRSFQDFQSIENTSWVAKELVKDYCSNYNPENKNFSLIRLRRRNQVQQIVSMYISTHRDKWSYIRENLDQYNKEIIPLNNSVLQTQIEFTIRQNTMCDELENVDYDLYYEDIVTLFNTGMSPTPYPANYKDLYQWVDSTYKEIVK